MIVLFLANLGLELQKSQPVTETIHQVSVTSQQLAEKSVNSAPPLTCPPCQSVMAPQEKKVVAPKLPVPQKFGSAPFLNKMEAVVKKILGRFEGRLFFFTGRRQGRTDSVLFLVDLQQEGRSKTLKGQIQVVLTDEDGKAYSRNAGNGGNKTIKYAAQERMVYIEASPTSFFAIKESEFDQNEIRGDYYDDDKLVGRTVLIRQ